MSRTCRHVSEAVQAKGLSRLAGTRGVTAKAFFVSDEGGV